MTDATHIPATRHRPQANLRGLMLFAALCAVASPIFWIGLGSLGRAWVTPEYSHGPLIPLISLYLFLRERRHTAPVPGAFTAKPGLALITFALLLGIFGNLIAIPDIVTYALILWTGGVMLTVLGWHQGRHHWAPGHSRLPRRQHHRSGRV